MKRGITLIQLLLILSIIFILVVLIGVPLAQRSTVTTATITIDKMESKLTGSGDSAHAKYLIWTKEGEVFEDTDAWWFGKFNSSDIYGQLKADHTYKVKVAGWRKPIFSWYRNILKVEEEIKSLENSKDKS